MSAALSRCTARSDQGEGLKGSWGFSSPEFLALLCISRSEAPPAVLVRVVGAGGEERRASGGGSLLYPCGWSAQRLESSDAHDTRVEGCKGDRQGR